METVGDLSGDRRKVRNGEVRGAGRRDIPRRGDSGWRHPDDGPSHAPGSACSSSRRDEVINQ